MSRLCTLTAYTLLAVLPLVVSSGLLSCEGTCTDQMFTAQVRATFLGFKEGSYWIYRNVANGDLDSIYFVSQTIGLQPGGRSQGTPICTMEEAVVNMKGFANDLPFDYHIKSWDNEMEISPLSAIAFRADYDLTKSANVVLQGITYRDVVTLTHCCSQGCNSACDKAYFRFLNLSYSPQVGMIKWEAENHPQYSKAVYELVRYKAIR